MTLCINDIQHDDTHHSSFQSCYAKCHCAQCRNCLNVMLSVVMLYVVVLSVVAPRTWYKPKKIIVSLIVEGCSTNLNPKTALWFTPNRHRTLRQIPWSSFIEGPVRNRLRMHAEWSLLNLIHIAPLMQFCNWATWYLPESAMSIGSKPQSCFEL
jgi:hypothetical protein